MTTSDGRLARLWSLASRVGNRVSRAFLVPSAVSAQGKHLDPAELPPPDPQSWTADQRNAWESEEMAAYRACLTLDGKDARAGVLDDLATYHRLSPEECRKRCLHWEAWSVEEWRKADRSTERGLQSFYDSVESWAFDLLWYAYLQTCGYGYPAPVVAVRFAKQRCPGGAHLDFGSGVGAMSQLFARQGFASMLADVSKPLLDFAKWRLERRGDAIPALNLASADLPTGEFDVITAIDTLVHVRDIEKATRDLHRALKPGGWLLTNFDVRAPADESAWHLHDDALKLEHQLRRAGFVERGLLAGMTICYQRVEPRGATFHARSLRDDLVFRSPGRYVTGTLRRVRLPTPERLSKSLQRALGAWRTRRGTGA
jgi:SAM-dependent methyltransferase